MQPAPQVWTPPRRRIERDRGGDWRRWRDADPETLHAMGAFPSHPSGFDPAAFGSDPLLPTSYPNLLAWWALPPKSLIASPSAYVSLTSTSVANPDNLSTASGWSNVVVTVTEATGGTTPDGHAYNLITTGATSGIQRIYHLGTSGVTGRNTVVGFHVKGTGWVKIGASTASTVGVWFNLDTGAKGTEQGGAIGTITADGAGGYIIQSKSTDSSYVQLWVTDADGTNNWTGGAGHTLYATAAVYSQDGVITTLYDRKVLIPGPYYGGTAYDATQVTFGNKPYYFGAIDADWSTGAPTVYNPGTSTTMVFTMPAGIVSALSGTNKGWEAIALLKLYATSAASPWALFRFTGTGEIRSPRGIGGTALWGRYHVSDAPATDSGNFSTVPAAAERAIRYNWQSTAENFYSGAAAPLTADASNPLTPTATGSTTVTAGQLFYNGGATGMAMGIREVALFQAGTNLSDAAANAIVAGMLARSSAAA